MIRGKEDLISQGILRPSSKDWRVRFVFLDGTEKVVRVSPGRIDEPTAVDRAMRHAKIFDASVLKETQAERVEPTAKVAGFGMIQKGSTG